MKSVSKEVSDQLRVNLHEQVMSQIWVQIIGEKIRKNRESLDN
jgi:hypothetical protein